VRSISLGFLLVLIGCTADVSAIHPDWVSIGVVRADKLAEAIAFLERDGIPSYYGINNWGFVGLRVPEVESARALRLLFKWREGREPRPYMTPEEWSHR